MSIDCYRKLDSDGYALPFSSSRPEESVRESVGIRAGGKKKLPRKAVIISISHCFFCNIYNNTHKILFRVCMYIPYSIK